MPFVWRTIGAATWSRPLPPRSEGPTRSVAAQKGAFQNLPAHMRYGRIHTAQSDSEYPSMSRCGKPLLVRLVKRNWYRRVESPDALYTKTIAQFVSECTRILDMGCGRSAPELTKLRARGTLTVGIDLVQSFSPAAKSSAHLVKADSCRVPFANSCFDLVVCGSVLEHLRDPRELLYEAHRVLVPGGYFFFLVPNLGLTSHSAHT